MHDFQVWRLARESWKFSHSLALACLTTLSCPTKLSAPSDIRPDAGHLRMFFIAAAPTATVLRQVHHRPCNKDVIHPWLDSWLSTASQSRQFSSTAHLERRLREIDEWRRPPSLTVVVRSLARRFCFSRGGNGVTTEWNIYTKTSFKRRKSRSARQHFESSNLSQVFVPPSMSMFFDMSIARCQAIDTRRSFHGKRTPFWLSLRLRCAGRSSHLKFCVHELQTGTFPRKIYLQTDVCAG